jgi:hypothetical protein
MSLKTQVLAWDRHKNGAELNNYVLIDFSLLICLHFIDGVNNSCVNTALVIPD